MGLGPGLVVVKRNNQGIEIAPRSTKGRRKVRVLLPRICASALRAGTNRANLSVSSGSCE